jgi:hypothetical protein
VGERLKSHPVVACLRRIPGLREVGPRNPSFARKRLTVKNRSTAVRVGAVIGAAGRFLLANGIAFAHDVVLGRTRGAQTGWGTAGCCAGFFLARLGAGVDAIIGALVARRPPREGGATHEESW